jgi:photosystem II stability/assembly factor-like uncharacterized protein
MNDALRSRCRLSLTALAAVVACAEAPVGSTAVATLAPHAAAAVMPWRPVQAPTISSLAVTPDGAIFGAAESDGLHRSDDDGLTWAAVEGAPGVAFDVAASPDGALYVATADGVVRSADGGGTWTPTTLDRYTRLVAVSDHGAVFAVVPGWDWSNPDPCDRRYGVFRSTDGGMRWQQIQCHLQPRDFIVNYVVGRKDDVFLGTHSDGEMWRRADGDWERFYGLYEVDGYQPPTTAMLPRPNGVLLAAWYGGILRSDDEGRSWKPALAEAAVLHLIGGETGGILAGAADGRVFRSDDDGISWTPVAAEIRRPYPSPEDLVVTRGGHLLAASFEGLFRTVRPGEL